jgi:hypothetical protein
MKPLSVIVLILAALPALGVGFQFPSAGFSRSPDARWKLVCKSPGSDSPESGHLLLLVSTNGESRELRYFDRHCDSLWSADSSQIAVTDWLGSNLPDVLIYSVTNLAPSISVGDLFHKGALSNAEISGHCYFEAIKWLDNHRLQIRVFGHTDELHSQSFEYAYVFDLSSQRFEKMIAKTPNKML